LSNTNADSILFSNSQSGAGYYWSAYPYNSPTGHYPYTPTAELSSFNNMKFIAPNAGGSTGDIRAQVSWFVLTRD
jgi:hypothetical protein